ncbi:amidohydrolase family protein [Frankia sp. AgB1.9]|uniref:amidohydrolase family protein n=1 Tax=unclassified Frankia TaxID=2632575 RepID=UPI00193408B2|nr:MULTISPECIES: amidohydrolase family protein [unclassified Frankia]MBL7487262.1 amidohydrolase family protein [Frankia sp. AgW1.1]MBL7546269.1 amidohydrolase family protein [Frankia sp. AgB1.9]MBL7618686.1 amidohydrolase family protein [Frankia sp. AgB1.8]
MPSRSLSYPVFDADNHLYETTDSFTRHLPREYDGLIKYVEVAGRTKIAIRNVISDYIPNPTFEVVAAPGAQEEYFRSGNQDGKSYREILGKPIRALAGFRDPVERIKIMDDLGLDGALMWPTLASLLEERLSDDPLATHAVIHALNQWMHDDWTFNYQNRIFPTPVINLGIVEEGIKELDWVLERGARVILIRPAPVPGLHGKRSFALPEFDPFWAKVAQADILVGLHASDSGYQRYVNEWEGIGDGEMLPFKGATAFSQIMRHFSRPIVDTMTSVIAHGLCTRFPTLKFAPIENGSNWVRPVLEALEFAYSFSPRAFDEDPVAVFKRNIFVHPFHEENPVGLCELIGSDRVLFGSDWPHPEGLADPITFVDDLKGLPDDDVRKVMGGNLAALLHVA